MRRVLSLLRSPFGSALLGGAVVAAFGWVAITAGWVAAEGAATTTVAAPLSAPVSDQGAEEGGNLVNRIYERDGEGVAFIEADSSAQAAPSPFNPFGRPRGGTASGSGFVIDGEGHVLTNSHVVDGADEIRVKLGDSEDSYDAELVGADPATDLALLKVDAPDARLRPLELGDSSEVDVGDPVVAIGNPFGLDRTVTSGIVSALQRQIQAPNGFAISNVIQTDAAINPGNSGGPLIDAEGRVIGINSQIQTGGVSGGNVGIGFAVPVNTAREVVRQLREDGEVQHAFLGIVGGTVTESLAQAVNLPVDSGALVQEVAPGGPADEAGLRGGDTSATIDGTNIRLGGDIIVKVGDREISSMDEVVNIVNAAESGDSLKLTVRRGAETKTLNVKLGDRPPSAENP